jgi:hypothetical protein
VVVVVTAVVVVVVVVVAVVVVATVVVIGVGSVVVCVVSVTVGLGGGAGGGVTGAGGGASSCCRPNTRFASPWVVSVAFGRNVAGDFEPIRPTLVTARISGAAHDRADAVPVGTSAITAATKATFSPMFFPIDPRCPGL